MGKLIKDTLLNILEATVELQKAALDIYSSSSAPKQKIRKVRDLAQQISTEAQDLPG